MEAILSEENTNYKAVNIIKTVTENNEETNFIFVMNFKREKMICIIEMRITENIILQLRIVRKLMQVK